MPTCRCHCQYKNTYTRYQGKYNTSNYEEIEYSSACLEPGVEEAKKFERNNKVCSYNIL